MSHTEEPVPPIYDPYRPHKWTEPSNNWSTSKVVHDPEIVDPIIAEAFYCHIGFWEPDLKTVMVLPRQYGRKDNSLYLHGPDLYTYKEKKFTSSSRLYRLVKDGKVSTVCATITLVDALALARSAVHSALSYRSVVIYGAASVVTEDAEKDEALNVLSEHIAPGYVAESRQSIPLEREKVGIIRIDFLHVSAKVRTGGPAEDRGQKTKDPADKWAGVLPIRQVYGPPITADYVASGVKVPQYVKNLTGSRGATNLVVTPPPPYTASASELTEERPPGTPLI